MVLLPCRALLWPCVSHTHPRPPPTAPSWQVCWAPDPPHPQLAAPTCRITAVIKPLPASHPPLLLPFPRARTLLREASFPHLPTFYTYECILILNNNYRHRYYHGDSQSFFKDTYNRISSMLQFLHLGTVNVWGQISLCCLLGAALCIAGFNRIPGP